MAGLDAGRGEIFSGHYEVDGKRALKISEKLLSKDEFLEELRKVQPVALITSDRSVAEASRTAGAETVEVDRPGSEDVARVGLEKLIAGETVSVEALDANYI